MSQGYSARLTVIWAAIVATVLIAVWLQSLKSEGDDSPAGTVPTAAEVAPVGLQSELLGKVVVAMNGLRGGAPTLTPVSIMQNAAPLVEEGAPFVDRLAHTVLVGLVTGWDQGVSDAKRLEPANDAERELRDLLVAALEARDSGESESVGESEVKGDVKGDINDEINSGIKNEAQAPDAAACARLEAKLGFFARVACDDPGVSRESTRMLVIGAVALGWYVGAFFIGLAALAYAIFMLWRSPPAASDDAASAPSVPLILGETFAIWMVLFLSLNIGASALGGLLVDALGLEGTPGATNVMLVCSIAGFFGSLAVLAYPVMRGLRGPALRNALGLHRGRGALREVGQGVLCYLSAVPLLVGGLIIYLVLNAIVTAVSGAPSEPGHPVTELYAGADATRIALTFLIAAVTAPIVEEIAFRGLLYGHLRATVLPKVHYASIFIAAIASSFIFAVIHPQGVLFTPALGGLAVSFCIFRELRGSLIAPMVAHAINNAVTLTLGLSLLT